LINASLSEGLLEDFNENGFLVLEKFIDLKYLEELKERLSQMNGTGSMVKIQMM